MQVTINNQSVEKGGTGTITYESTPHSEVKIDALLRNAAGYELQSVWGDVPVNVIFRRVSSSLARRWNGTAGAQVMAGLFQDQLAHAVLAQHLRAYTPPSPQTRPLLLRRPPQRRPRPRRMGT